MTAGPFVPLAVPRGSAGTENCRGQAGAARCYNPYACRFCFMRVDFTRRHATIRKTTGLPRREETYETAKDFFRKLIIGAVLLAIATGMTAFIKESLDTQDPESALPIITVLYGDEELVPDKEVRRAGWEWNFS